MPSLLCFHTCSSTLFWITSYIIPLNPYLLGWCFKSWLHIKFPFMEQYVSTWHYLTWLISILSHHQQHYCWYKQRSQDNEWLPDILWCVLLYLTTTLAGVLPGRCQFSSRGYLSFWKETLYHLCLRLLPNPVRLTVFYLPLPIMQLQLNMWQAWQGINKD